MKGEFGNTRLHFTGGAGETLKTPYALIFGVSDGYLSTET